MWGIRPTSGSTCAELLLKNHIELWKLIFTTGLQLTAAVLNCHSDDVRKTNQSNQCFCLFYLYINTAEKKAAESSIGLFISPKSRSTLWLKNPFNIWPFIITLQNVPSPEWSVKVCDYYQTAALGHASKNANFEEEKKKKDVKDHKVTAENWSQI